MLPVQGVCGCDALAISVLGGGGVCRGCDALRILPRFGVKYIDEPFAVFNVWGSRCEG